LLADEGTARATDVDAGRGMRLLDQLRGQIAHLFQLLDEGKRHILRDLP
jgi:hypothetical protein